MGLDSSVGGAAAVLTQRPWVRIPCLNCDYNCYYHIFVSLDELLVSLRGMHYIFSIKQLLSGLKGRVLNIRLYEV